MVVIVTIVHWSAILCSGLMMGVLDYILTKDRFRHEIWVVLAIDDIRYEDSDFACMFHRSS